MVLLNVKMSILSLGHDKYIFSSFFYIPDIMAHVLLYGVCLNAWERGSRTALEKLIRCKDEIFKNALGIVARLVMCRDSYLRM